MELQERRTTMSTIISTIIVALSLASGASADDHGQQSSPSPQGISTDTQKSTEARTAPDYSSSSSSSASDDSSSSTNSGSSSSSSSSSGSSDHGQQDSVPCPGVSDRTRK